MKHTFFIACMATLLLASCKSAKDRISTASYHSYQTECLGKSMDGSQTLRVWASGRNRTDAIEQAMKKAVYDVTFSGITAGSGDCNSYPVIDEANARTKYEDYFDAFFANGGAYKKYVSVDNQKRTAMDRIRGNGNEIWGITVVVNRSLLRQRYKADNIIAN